MEGNEQEPENLGPKTRQKLPINSSKYNDLSIFRYLKAELTRGYILDRDEAKYEKKREDIYTFLNIPVAMEKFMYYGFLQCTETFLYVFTFLPIRCLLATVKLVTHPCGLFSTGQRVLEPAQICDLLKAVLFVVCALLMNYVDTSMMYHIIRGQVIIKLYIFFNLLEVADRLFSSVGQDILDALFWTATEPRGHKREHIGLLPHLALAILYVLGHAVLVLFQATTINVAFNSHNKVLLTIMMSNNFVELKGSVFKKFDNKNLFQMVCSDVRERFHFIILLVIVCVRNMTEFSWNMDHLWTLIPDILMIMISEVFVDWVKHAFITKFNGIPAEVYHEYCVSLSKDVIGSRQRQAYTDQFDLISRKFGFIPLPLGVLLYRIISQSVTVNTVTAWGCIVLAYIWLSTTKLLCSIIVLGKSHAYVNSCAESKQSNADTDAKCSKDLPKNTQTPVKTPPKSPVKEKRVTENGVGNSEPADSSAVPPTEGELVPSNKDKGPAPPLSEIDRYTMCSNRIV